jgi:hypothetical protein
MKKCGESEIARTGKDTDWKTDGGAAREARGIQE